MACETVKVSRFLLAEGDAAPWYMGLAWHDYYRNVAVILPIPLNLIVRLGRDFYLWIRNPWQSSMTKGEQAAYERGVKDGMTQAAVEFIWPTRKEAR